MNPGCAETVASLLGNFTINQFCGLQLKDDAVDVHYAVVLGNCRRCANCISPMPTAMA